MRTSFARRLVLGALVCGALAVAPTAASATTTYGSFSNVCLIREYPPESCENGWNEFVVGYGSGGESVSIFNVTYSVPAGKEVCEATLRVTNTWTWAGTVDVGDAGPNWDISDTWYTWDAWSEIDVWESWSPGSAGEDEIDLTDEIANHSGPLNLAFFGPNSSGGALFDPELEIEYATSC